MWSEVQLLLTQPEAPGSQGALVPGAGVLIGGDWRELQHPLGPSTVDALRPQINEDQVVVGPIWNIQRSQWKPLNKTRVQTIVGTSPPF